MKSVFVVATGYYAEDHDWAGVFDTREAAEEFAESLGDDSAEVVEYPVRPKGWRPAKTLVLTTTLLSNGATWRVGERMNERGATAPDGVVDAHGANVQGVNVRGTAYVRTCGDAAIADRLREMHAALVAETSEQLRKK